MVSDLLVRFDELVDHQFTQLRLVKRYADQLNITERRLQQLTLAATGKTPKQLIDARVVLEAKRLLKHTDESVKAIGFALGFEEPTNFIRFFRQNAKQTPAEFRASPIG